MTETKPTEQELTELKESFRKQYEISEHWRKLSETEHAHREKAEQALSLRGEPTMGMWDDFCSVFPVPFDDFLKAYKFMVGNMPALRGEPVANGGTPRTDALKFDVVIDGKHDNDARISLEVVKATDCAKIEADLIALYAAPISGERAIPAGHCTLFVPHSSACAQQAQCLAVSGERVREAQTFEEFWSSDGVDVYLSVPLDPILQRELCELAFNAGRGQ